MTQVIERNNNTLEEWEGGMSKTSAERCLPATPVALLLWGI